MPTPVKKTAAAKKTPAKKPAKAAPKKSPEKKENVNHGAGRPVAYPEISVKIHDGVKGPRLTFEEAKEYLGWETEADYIERMKSDTKVKDKSKVSFGSDFIVEDPDGNKIRCWNNLGNRPFDKTTAKAWESEVLEDHWRFNGEPLIIGKTAIIISAQHRLIGFCLAVLEWRKNKDRWPAWKEEPTLPCLIVRGIEETDEVINTIDTGKPRSLSDVIYRSEFFSDLTQGKREKAARIASYAIKFLAHRTGAFKDAFSKKRTHADSLDFVARHNTLLACVRHIQDEDEEGKISRFISPGYASALLYLMRTSTSDLPTYAKTSVRDESSLNFDMSDKAEEFWVHLGQEDKSLKALTSLKEMMAQSVDAASLDERVAMIVKAWEAYSTGKKITSETLELKYDEEDGVKTLAECPKCGGIDIGRPQDLDDGLDPENTVEAFEKTVEKKKARQKKAEVGSHVWVPEDGGYWEGDIEEIYQDRSGKEIAKVRMNEEKIFDHPYHELLTVNPEA